MLLLDLDYTIFPTNTIARFHFQPLIDLVTERVLELHGEELVAPVIQDLWRMAFDRVVHKYQLPPSFQQAFSQQLNQLNYQFDIQPYPDYQDLLTIPQKRILVTTGFRQLQQAKIKALQIAPDFSEIYIDDPMDQPRLYKKGIFAAILNRINCNPKEIYVIGDSPENELKAGKSLGMRTIQRLKPGFEKSDVADAAIHSFSELESILRL